MEVGEKDPDKTAFTSHYGLFHFSRMPTILSNSPGPSTRNGRPVDNSQEAIYPSLVGPHCHIFAYGRRSHRSRLTSYDFMIRSGREITTEELRNI